MKKLLVFLLTIIFCFSFISSYAEKQTISQNMYDKFIPNYEEMIESRILIGENSAQQKIYEFQGQNYIYDYSGYYRLMTPSEIQSELDRRGIKYTNIFYTTVNIAEFLVITLIDDSCYGLEILRTYDEQPFIHEDSLRRLCQYYFGFEYDYCDK